ITATAGAHRRRHHRPPPAGYTASAPVVATLPDHRPMDAERPPRLGRTTAVDGQGRRMGGGRARRVAEHGAVLGAVGRTVDLHRQRRAVSPTDRGPPRRTGLELL